jgi:hypothetical protein
MWQFGHGEIIKNTARLNVNAAGFYAIVGVQDFLPRSPTAIAALFAAIRAANAGCGSIIVILDNFSSYHAVEVT